MGEKNIFIKRVSVKPTAVYETFWRFAAKRQDIFFRRCNNAPPPWTDDFILNEHKFTNAYRASDRVSQFLIKNVLYKGDQSATEIFFRCILFKIFNRISTWDLLEKGIQEVRYSTYSFDKYDRILERARARGERIFSAAYIMPSHAEGFNQSAKHRNYLLLLEKMMKENVPLRLTKSKSMADAFELLLSYPLIGNFLAYQFVTDLNYSNLLNFSEMEFVVAGPGAKDGIQKCFTEAGNLGESDIIKFMADHQNEEFSRLGLNFQTLWGRPLQLIDCQNLFCEVSKYARMAHPEIKGKSGRTRIKQKFTANSQPIRYWFPPKWKINESIENPDAIRSSQPLLFSN